MPVPVSRRKVWYFHGFDPATTARYRRIFAAASDRLGVVLDDLPTGDDGWHIRRGNVSTKLRYCRYEDLVRDFQYAPMWRRAWRGLVALGGYIKDGATQQMGRYGPWNLSLAFAPVTMSVSLVVMTTLGSLIFLPGIFAAAMILVAIGLIVVLFPALYFHLIMDLFAHMRALALGTGPAAKAYEARIADMAAAVTPGDEDEALLVGHSLGGIAVIRVVDRLLDTWPADRSIGLLTLGSVHGTVLVQQGAGRDRLAAAIRRIAEDNRVFWVDVSSPRDAFCLPLLDPLVLTGGDADLTSPRVISAKLRFAPKIPGDRRTVFSAMRRHMGYLLTPQRGSGFDYADTISGDQSLVERFGPRRNSPKARMRGA